MRLKEEEVWQKFTGRKSRTVNNFQSMHLIHSYNYLGDHKQSSSSDDNTKTSGLSSKESKETSTQSKQNEKVNITGTRLNVLYSRDLFKDPGNFGIAWLSD